MDATTPRLERLGALIRARRQALGLSKARAFGRAGISNRTWNRAEDGLPVEDWIWTKIELALQWPDGVIAGFLEGGAPPSVAPERRPPEVQQRTVEVRNDRERRVVEALLEQLRAEEAGQNPPPDERGQTDRRGA